MRSGGTLHHVPSDLSVNGTVKESEITVDLLHSITHLREEKNIFLITAIASKALENHFRM